MSSLAHPGKKAKVMDASADDADCQRLGTLLGVAVVDPQTLAAVTSAVKAAVAGKSLGDQLGWLAAAQSRLSADSRRNKTNKVENQSCTAHCLAPAVVEMSRSNPGWGAALCSLCSSSTGHTLPAELLDAALCEVAGAKLEQGGDWRKVWTSVEPVFVDLAQKLLETSLIAREPDGVQVLRLCVNLASSGFASGAYVLHAQSAGEWVPSPQQIPQWMGGRGELMGRGKALEETGLLGRMFGMGCIPDAFRKMHQGQGIPDQISRQPVNPWDAGELGNYYFPDARSLLRRRPADVASEVEMLGRQVRELQQEQLRMLKNLLRKDTVTREPTLNWLAAAVEVNAERAKEYALHIHRYARTHATPLCS